MATESGGEIITRLVFDPSGAVAGARTAAGATRQIDTASGTVSSRAGAAFGSVRARLMGIVAAAGLVVGIVGTLARAVREAGDAARGLDRLRVALRNAGDASESSVQGLADIAAGLQATTNYTDDSAIAAATLLASFRSVAGAQGVGLLLPRLADLSAGMARAGEAGMDLEQVARLVGRAVEGNVAGLARFGIVLSDAEKAAIEAATGIERVELVAAALDARFKGMAAAGADPFTILENSVGELYEALGQNLAPAVQEVASQLAAIARNEGFLAFLRAVGSAIALVVREGANAADAIASAARVMAPAAAGAKNLQDQLTALEVAARVVAFGFRATSLAVQVLISPLRLVQDLAVAVARAMRGDLVGAVVGYGNALRDSVGVMGDTVRGMTRVALGTQELGGKVRGLERDLAGPEGVNAALAGTAGAANAAAAAIADAARRLQEYKNKGLNPADLPGQSSTENTGPPVAPFGTMGVPATDGILESLAIVSDKVAELNRQWEDAKRYPLSYSEAVAASFGTLAAAIGDFYEASGRGSREGFAVYKAIAIAEAIVSTYLAAQKALASAPPPLNYVLAAGVVAAGLANVARIRAANPGSGSGGGGTSGGSSGAAVGASSASYAPVFNGAGGRPGSPGSPGGGPAPPAVNVQILARASDLYAVVQHGEADSRATRGTDRA